MTAYETGFRWAPGGGFVGFRESPDGRYWVADHGQCLHARRDCEYLWASGRAVVDATRTLAYRLLRGDPVTGPDGNRLRWVCSRCVVGGRVEV